MTSYQPAQRREFRSTQPGRAQVPTVSLPRDVPDIGMRKCWQAVVAMGPLPGTLRNGAGWAAVTRETTSQAWEPKHAMLCSPLGPLASGALQLHPLRSQAHRTQPVTHPLPTSAARWIPRPFTLCQWVGGLLPPDGGWPAVPSQPLKMRSILLWRKPPQTSHTHCAVPNSHPSITCHNVDIPSVFCAKPATFP